MYPLKILKSPAFLTNYAIFFFQSYTVRFLCLIIKRQWMSLKFSTFEKKEMPEDNFFFFFADDKIGDNLKKEMKKCCHFRPKTYFRVVNLGRLMLIYKCSLLYSSSWCKLCINTIGHLASEWIWNLGAWFLMGEWGGGQIPFSPCFFFQA